VKKLGLVLCLLFVFCFLMRADFYSSKCREPVLIEILHPELPARPKGPFTVITLNMAGNSSAQQILDEFERLPVFSEADVVFLQEVVHSEEGEAVLKTLVDRLHLHAAFATSTEPGLDGKLEGIAILSRRRIYETQAFDLNRFGLHLRSRCRLALAATVETPFGQPVRVFGVHLDTRINSTERRAQLLPVIEAAESFDGPAIIGGDFNTNDVYWVRHLLPVPYLYNQRQPLRKFLQQRGFSTPLNGDRPTFEHFGFGLDWIFLRSLTASEWGIEPIGFSDHRAVWMRLGSEEAAGSGS
jgi:endonuclease/exonuclease/phosphatase (EEP) superfamily protein YafD